MEPSDISGRLLILEDRIARFEREFDAFRREDFRKMSETLESLERDWKMVQRGGSVLKWVIALLVGASAILATIKGWVKL